MRKREIERKAIKWGIELDTSARVKIALLFLIARCIVGCTSLSPISQGALLGRQFVFNADTLTAVCRKTGHTWQHDAVSGTGTAI